MTKTLPKVIEFTAPVKVISEANTRCHWTVRRARFKAQAEAVRWFCAAAFMKVQDQDVWRSAIRGPLAVTLTRVGPRRLDSDNLAGSFKSVRDQLARSLDVDDGDKRLTWKYEQEKGNPREYAIRVRIESTEAEGDRG